MGRLRGALGLRGACGGCWCMWWRLTRPEFEAGKGDGNKAAMKTIVDGGHVPGILAFDGDMPVGWCSVAPRKFFPRVLRSRTLKPVDDRPVWSVVCFFVEKAHRRKGVALALLNAAAAHARAQGATILEGYPFVDPPADLPGAFIPSRHRHHLQAGRLQKTAQQGKSRVIMRKTLV